MEDILHRRDDSVDVLATHPGEYGQRERSLVVPLCDGIGPGRKPETLTVIWLQVYRQIMDVDGNARLTQGPKDRRPIRREALQRKLDDKQMPRMTMVRAIGRLAGQPERREGVIIPRRNLPASSEKDLQQLKAKGAQAQARNVPMETVGPFRFYSIRFAEPADPAVLRSSTDAIRKADPEAIICLADSKGMLVATSGNTAQKSGIGANLIVKLATETAGGSGGGRPDMAQGRLKEPAKFPQVIERIKQLMREKG